MRQASVVTGYIILSVLAASILLFTSIANTTAAPAPDGIGRYAVAVAFMGSCLLGIVLAAGKRRLCSYKRGRSGGDARRSGGRSMVGHHPDCGRFGGSVITLLGKDRCAGCLGLALGCAISFIAMAAYLLLPNVDAGMAPLLVLFGLSAVAACFVEVAWHPSGPWWHVLSNLLLPVGFLLVTIGVMEVASGTAFGLLAVLMSFLWLDTRVQLSEWRNARVCETCGQLCKSY